MTTSPSPLLVACPGCGDEFPVDPARVPARGIHAICSSCMRTFPVTATPEESTEVRDAGFQDLSSLASEALAEDQDEEKSEMDAHALASGAARFGQRDPHDRARRLARVLVSDIIAYYPDKHAQAVEEDKIRETFEEEVEKSRREYVEQVGREMADSTDYFREALNEVLARGEEVY